MAAYKAPAHKQNIIVILKSIMRGLSRSEFETEDFLSLFGQLYPASMKYLH